MTAREMATEFVSVMNPENVTDGTPNFAIYEFELPDPRYHLEVCFIEEDFADETDPCFYTAIDVIGKDGCVYNGMSAEVKTMTDIDAIANSIDYFIKKLGVNE